MSVACGKKARKRFGNRYAIKRAFRRRHAKKRDDKKEG